MVKGLAVWRVRLSGHVPSLRQPLRTSLLEPRVGGSRQDSHTIKCLLVFSSVKGRMM